MTRYADAKQALADLRLSKNLDMLPGGRESSRVPIETRIYMGKHMHNADPPDHTRLRRAIAREFTPRKIASLDLKVSQLAEDLIDRMEQSPDRTADLITDFALPLPLRMLCKLLGLPAGDAENLRRWTENLTNGETNAVTRLSASRSLNEYLTNTIKEKQKLSSRDDLISALIIASRSSSEIDDEELVSTLFLLIVSGFETAAHLIGNSVYLLLTHREQIGPLLKDMNLAENVIEEALRLRSPVETTMRRFTVEPVRIGSVTIPAGQVVLVSLASANRNPAGPLPNRTLDVLIGKESHLAFGHGIHRCVGAPLAKMQGRIAVEALFTRLPNLRLSVPVSTLAWRPAMLLRGLRELPVCW
ncbi:cytochrome P450 [Streptomyces sp. SID13031]|uniref:cytochrome P450 family protein n=1 Tax=Streptomyces sp. SID13031 TaxID=2706046 RepID=UPI0013DFCE79